MAAQALHTSQCDTEANQQQQQAFPQTIGRIDPGPDFSRLTRGYARYLLRRTCLDVGPFVRSCSFLLVATPSLPSTRTGGVLQNGLKPRHPTNALASPRSDELRIDGNTSYLPCGKQLIRLAAMRRKSVRRFFLQRRQRIPALSSVQSGFSKLVSYLCRSFRAGFYHSTEWNTVLTYNVGICHSIA